MNRIAIFVDVRDVYKNVKKYYNSKLNYEKFLSWAAGNNSVVYAGAYVILSDDTESQNKFYDALRLSGYDVKTKNAFYGTDDKGNKFLRNSWVLGISLDISNYCDKVDTVVIVSSNREFVDTCYFFRHKARIEIISIKEATDNILIKACTDFTSIPEDVCDKIEEK